MNNERRKRINDLISSLEATIDEIQTLAGEERDAFEAMPEGLQASERGQASEAAADALDSAMSCAEDAKVYLEEALG